MPYLERAPIFNVSATGHRSSHCRSSAAAVDPLAAHSAVEFAILPPTLPPCRSRDSILTTPSMGKSKATAKSKASSIGEEAANDDDALCQWLTRRGVVAASLCVSVFGLLVRVGVSLHSYSGAGDPPKYGDFEAQRHWMEITTNLLAAEWYRNSSVNDLRYWGLDYSPLTAYQSYVHGLWLKSVLPESARGHESVIQA